MQSSLSSSKLEPVYRDRYREFNFKEKYYEFDKNHFLELARNDESVVERLLDFIHIIYTQFQHNPSLLFQNLEHEFIYKNFDISFTKSLANFSIKNICRYLNILHHDVIRLDEEVNAKSSKESFLKSIMSSAKIEAIDLIIVERWQSMTTTEFCQYIFLIGKVGLKDSLVVRDLRRILETGGFKLESDFPALMLFTIGLGLLAPNDPFIYFQLENRVLNGPFYQDKFYRRIGLSSIMTILLTFENNHSTRELWKKFDSEFFEEMQPNFKESLMIICRKVSFGVSSQKDLKWLSAFSEFQNPDKWLHLLEWRKFSEVMNVFLGAFEVETKNRRDLLEKWEDSFFEFIRLNWSSLNKELVYQRIRILCQFYHLFKISYEQFGSAAEYLFDKNWENLRTAMNNLLRNERELPSDLALDLYLTIGNVHQVTESNCDFLLFFRRKLYHHILHSLPNDDPITVFVTYQKIVVHNYLFDEVITDLVEFCLLKFYEGYNLKEKLIIACLYQAYYISTKSEHSKSMEGTSKRRDFALFAIFQTFDALEKCNDSLRSIDFRIVNQFSKVVQYFEEEFRAENSEIILQMVGRFEKLIKPLKDTASLIEILERSSITEFTKFKEEAIIGFYTMSQILQTCSQANEHKMVGPMKVRIDFQHLIDMGRYTTHESLYSDFDQNSSNSEIEHIEGQSN
jgi:hypothetical protein